MKFKIIIPVYNEEKYIQGLINQFPTEQKKHLIFVDDGSKDKTSKILKKSQLRFVRHKINLGKGIALQTGTLAALKENPDIIIFMDGDLQHKPSDILDFLTTFKKNPNTDLIIGARQIGTQMKLKAFLANKILTIIINLLFKTYLSDTQCGFRAFKSSAYSKIAWESHDYAVETEILVNAAKNNLKVVEIPIHTIYIDEHKGTNFIDGIKIIARILILKLTK